MSNRLLTRTLLNSLGVIAYVLTVATVMHNANRLFGTEDTIFAVTGFLMLFSVSAAVVGSLVFGYPLVLFLGGQKREGIMAAAATIGWMVLEVAVILIVAASVS